MNINNIYDKIDTDDLRSDRQLAFSAAKTDDNVNIYNGNKKLKVFPKIEYSKCKTIIDNR